MQKLVHDPQDRIERIDEFWAAVSVDGNGQVLCATRLNGMVIPLIAADDSGLIWVKEQAEKLATLTGRRIKLIKLTGRVEFEELWGAGEGGAPIPRNP
ncbi:MULTISPECIES: hypothetical protein [Rhodomicrobium]|uniref:hypothetical protein n=1 Tax=Rhodomicrobium TaxID=1068 RepID=UPI000B4B5A53|nr:MULTISPECIES: hypothetical protein [Rhodomicrobium]